MEVIFWGVENKGIGASIIASFCVFYPLPNKQAKIRRNPEKIHTEYNK